MVDLKSQYLKIKSEIDLAIESVITHTDFINGKVVSDFSDKLSDYLDGVHVIPCANGTDALQIALMALQLDPGDEILVPAFTYVATAEVIALLGLKPKMIDVDMKSFNTNVDLIKDAISDKTKVILPVHLFGQSSDMEDILSVAKANNIYVVEDNAQAIGSEYTFKDGCKEFTGCMGDIGTTSFFPSKNLGCFGDGGALFTRNKELAERIKMIANHGQSRKYVHDLVGCNSRLDSIQAAVLNVKLNYLNEYNFARQKAADFYFHELKGIHEIVLPTIVKNSTHVFHQFTIRVLDGKRDELKKYLNDKGISANIYYPIPLYKQRAYTDLININSTLPNTEKLCKEVLSIPIHTELKSEDLEYITNTIKDFFYG